jgi:hypothetical protein
MLDSSHRSNSRLLWGSAFDHALNIESATVNWTVSVSGNYSTPFSFH